MPLGQMFGATELPVAIDTVAVLGEFEPMAIASLPCFNSSGGWPTASARNNWDVGAPRPCLNIFW